MNNLGKFFTSLFCLSLLSTAFAHQSMDERIDSLEREMQEISTQTPQENLGVNFTTASPHVDGKGVFVTFDILYWHAKVGGTEFAYTTQSEIDGINQLVAPIKGSTKSNEFDWGWGLKAGLGYNVPHDEWDIYAQYTWFQDHTTDRTSKRLPSFLVPTRFIFVTVPAEKIKSFFDLSYNNVDLEVARSYFLSSYLSFRPFVGLKSAWIDLHQRINHTANNLIPTVGGFDFKTRDASKFWGMGPRIGVNSKWHLGYGFSLFADIAASLLYGYFKTSHSELGPPHVTQTGGIEDGKIVKVRSKFHNFVPYVRMYDGLEWGGYVNHNKQHIRLKLGYEVQYYWRVNQMVYPQDSQFTFTFPPLAVVNRHDLNRLSEDVMFYGVTGEFRLDF